MTAIDWHAFDLTPLASHLRATAPGADTEKTVWAFEHALAAARSDEELLGYLLAATVCLLARAGGTTPRDVLEQFFRRSASDASWRTVYADLLP